ncbi:MAG: response regulator [Roseburia sp.]|nr:response regulator [Roseburia sp.]
MKRKILLSGSNRTLMNDFFTQMEFTFECMITSERWDDAQCHIKYFQPDLMVFCLWKETKSVLNNAARLKFLLSDKDIPVVIIGDKQDCIDFNKAVPGMSSEEMYRPIPVKEIERKLTSFLDKRDKQKQIVEEAMRVPKREEEPEPEDFSEFLFDIPEMPIPEAMMPEEPEGQKHILIVDDDASMLRMMKNYLSEDYHVATAISGKVALKFLETKHTDLVLLDYEMPGENGADVLAEIRSNPGLKDLPVIFLTGVTDRGKIEQVLSNNIQGYLLKPINVERLSDTIVGLLH